MVSVCTFVHLAVCVSFPVLPQCLFPPVSNIPNVGPEHDILLFALHYFKECKHTDRDFKYLVLNKLRQIESI